MNLSRAADPNVNICWCRSILGWRSIGNGIINIVFDTCIIVAYKANHAAVAKAIGVDIDPKTTSTNGLLLVCLTESLLMGNLVYCVNELST